MVRVQPHAEASTQLAMKWPLLLFHSQNWNRSLGGLPVTRKLQSCLNWRKIFIPYRQVNVRCERDGIWVLDQNEGSKQPASHTGPLRSIIARESGICPRGQP